MKLISPSIPSPFLALAQDPDEADFSQVFAEIAAAAARDYVAVRCFLIWVQSNLRHGRATAWLTDGPWSHMAIGFDLSSGRRVYYEALYSEGFVGPMPLESLENWLKKDAKRKSAISYTSLIAQTAQEIRVMADRMAGNTHDEAGIVRKAGYNKLQLLAMAAAERYGLPVPSSESRVVCSEAVSRLLHPHIDLRDHRRQSHDEVNPNSAWHRWLEYLAGFGSITAPAVKPA